MGAMANAAAVVDAVRVLVTVVLRLFLKKKRCSER